MTANTANSWDSHELLQQIQQRDSRAATEVVDRYVERLLALTRARIGRKLRRRVDPSDVVQSAYRSFFSHVRRAEFAISAPGDLWRLLARITLHKLYHQVERHTAARRGIQLEDTGNSPIADFLAARDPTPADAVTIVEQLCLISKQLTDPEREVFTASLQGQPLEQISIAIGKSQRTARRLLDSARHKIERQLHRTDKTAQRRADALRFGAIDSRSTLEYSDFVLQRLVGAGGMGKVYQATQRVTGRTIAIKALPKTRQANPHVIEKFLQEAQILAQLEHPNIVGFRGVGRFPGGGHFIAMDFIDGENLQSRLDNGPIATDEALKISRSVASAIAYAHDQRIVHGDLKPANVLQDRDARVVVTDFGLAQFIADRAAPARPRWLVGGTIGYMAPEVRAHAGAPTVAADVYGLGAFLWALVTGAPPTRGAQYVDLAVPPSIAAVCKKCLSENPAERFRSVRDLLGVLSID